MPTPEAKARRATDNRRESQAVRMERLEGQHQLLVQRVTSAMENMTNSMGSVQVEVRNNSARVSELTGLQSAHDSNKTALEEVKRSVGALNERLETWFDEFETKQEQRWMRFEAERDQWRLRHELDQDTEKKEVEKEIRAVRETVIRFIGFGAAIGLLANVIIGGFLWSMNYRFSENKEDTDRVEALAISNRQIVDKISAEYNKELSDIKLYLARGGRVPEEPYVPQDQRKK